MKGEQALQRMKSNLSSRWVKVDCTGQSTLLDVDKFDIMHRAQINSRDLRILDPLLCYPSTILGRERAIVLNLEHIKAIITSEEVFLRNPSDENVIPVIEQLQRRLPPVIAVSPSQRAAKKGFDQESEEGESPFEFRGLEVALEAICSFLAARSTELETSVYPALDELTSKISSRNLDRVRKLKCAMTRLTARVQRVRDELEQLLDDDDDMAELYLSRKFAGPVAPPDFSSNSVTCFPSPPTLAAKFSSASRTSVRGGECDIEDLEMLLEAHFIQTEGILNKLLTLKEYIDDTEDYINIQLDNHRNQLIQLELFLRSGNFSLTFCALITGIFGINIPNIWNHHHGYMFKWVAISSGLLSAFIFIFITAYARTKGLVGS